MGQKLIKAVNLQQKSIQNISLFVIGSNPPTNSP